MRPQLAPKNKNKPNIPLFCSDSPNKLEKLIINGRFLTQKTSGVQVFALGLCRELKQAGVVFSIVVPAHEKIQIPEFENQLIRMGKLNGHLWEQLELPKYIRKEQALLLNLCNTGPMRLGNQVTVLHDLAFLVNPKWFHPVFGFWYRFLIPKMVRACRYLLTVSSSIRSELMEKFSLPPDSIQVISNKVDDSLLQSIAEKPEGMFFLPGEYYLMVGSNDPRKNFEFAAEILTSQLEKNVVMVGMSHRNFNSQQSIQSDRICRLGHINTAQLKWLYENAKALVSPSLYEGFGIPNLEAMALHCPLICSNIAVFREICGQAALYFNPTDRGELVDVIRQLESNNAEIKLRIATGVSRFSAFQSMDRAAVVKSLLKS